jgi:ubiquinone/menaquinone biosynthesis C-methylase UbiE
LEVWLTRDLLPSEEKEIFQSYYSSYIRCFSDYTKYHYNQQTKELIKVIQEKQSPHILEVGYGCGTESLWMAYQGGLVRGIDISSDKFKVANERKQILEKYSGKNLICSFEQKSLFDIEEDEQYDIIYLELSLHHIEPREKALDKLSKLLKIGGLILVTECNAWNPLLQFLYFKKRGFSTVKTFKDANGKENLYGDERVFTANWLESSLLKRGISRKSLQYFRLFPNTKLADNLMLLENKIPQWFVPLFTHYSYTGIKKS